jgi:hypothetical protein
MLEKYVKKVALANWFHILWGVLYAGNKQLSSLLYYFSNGHVFKVRNWMYRDNDTVLFFFAHALLNLRIFG